MMTTTALHALGGLLAGYLFGSFSTAVITCKLMGLPDPRGEGSGNPGATNVLRFGGKKAAIITLLGDALKGLLPVLLACAYLKATGLTLAWLPAVAGLGAFLGHLYPLYFEFKGGKGVATAFGVLLGVAWPVFLLTLATWLAMAAIFKYSALAALTAFALAPVFAAVLTGSTTLTLLILAITVLIVWRHRSNIVRLINGTEGKIGHKPGQTTEDTEEPE